MRRCGCYINAGVTYRCDRHCGWLILLLRRWLAALFGALVAFPALAHEITIPDPMAYVVQSVRPDGNPGSPMRAGDAVLYGMFDIGQYQRMVSYMCDPHSARVACTAWSYYPYGTFKLDANGHGVNGDGGERYELQDNGEVWITHTQDGSTPGVQTFSVPWVVVSMYTIPCSEGWTTHNEFDRTCRATVELPLIGKQDCVVSDHGDQNAVERSVFCKGWGRRAWIAFNRTLAGEAYRDVAARYLLDWRCRDFGWNWAPHEGMHYMDCRISVDRSDLDFGLLASELWP